MRLRDAPFGDQGRFVRPPAAAIAFPADNVEDFPFLYAYSPLHHIAQGTGAKVVSAITVSCRFARCRSKQ